MKNAAFRFSVLILIAALVFSLFEIASFADFEAQVYYIDSENGDDENDGKSEGTAWETLENLKELELNPGDSILLKSGGVYEGSIAPESGGTKDAHITVSSYGEGEKPLLKNDKYSILMPVINVSYLDISGLHFSAKDGCAIYILADGEDASFITISDCDFSDIHPEELKSTSTFHAAINISNTEDKGRVHDILIERINVENCAYGMHTSGNDPEIFGIYAVPETDYNYNITVKDSIFRNCQGGAVIIGCQYKSKVENCLIEDCATNKNFACAPIWFRHSDSCTVSHCEVSGSTNKQDGMTIDFDGWTTNCTYEYIYSHDNNRFIKNCLFDSHTHNSGNTVRYCLSVNDNNKRNLMNTPLVKFENILGTALRMKNFTFINNTLVNISPIHFDLLSNATIKNNIIVGQSNKKWQTVFTNLTSLLSTGDFDSNCFFNFSVPLNAGNSITSDPEFDENYVSTALPSNMGALNGNNYVGCRLDATDNG